MNQKKKINNNKFNPQNCAIPSVYCGNGNSLPERTNDKYYTRKGTQYECLQKGIGTGMAIERTRGLPNDSLQQIKYVGVVYEANFKKLKIQNTTQLINYSKVSNKATEELLRRVFIKKGGVFDEKAYNSTLLFLYNKGLNNLPQCIKL